MRDATVWGGRAVIEGTRIPVWLDHEGITRDRDTYLAGVPSEARIG